MAETVGSSRKVTPVFFTDESPGQAMRSCTKCEDRKKTHGPLNNVVEERVSLDPFPGDNSSTHAHRLSGLKRKCLFGVLKGIYTQ